MLEKQHLIEFYKSEISEIISLLKSGRSRVCETDGLYRRLEKIAAIVDRIAQSEVVQKPDEKPHETLEISRDHYCKFLDLYHAAKEAMKERLKCSQNQHNTPVVPDRLQNKLIAALVALDEVQNRDVK